MKITKLPNQITDKVKDIDSLCLYLNIKREDLFLFSEDTEDKHEKFINASNILIKVAQVYNEGTILNWKDTSIYKYIPYIYISGGSFVVTFYAWCGSLVCSAGLYYKSQELAKEAYNNFKPYFEDYWQIKVS